VNKKEKKIVRGQDEEGDRIIMKKKNKKDKRSIPHD